MRQSLLGMGRPPVIAAITVVLAVAGCRHRHVQPVLLPPQTPVSLVEVPAVVSLPLVKEPETTLPPVPVTQVSAKTKKVKKRSVKPSTASAPVPIAPLPSKPADIAPAAAPTAEATKSENAVAEIGALTVGGEQSPQALQSATDLISINERRLSALGADAARAQAELISKVRTFQRDALLALQSGDADGAKTLATKGKLLLDDLQKGDTH